MNNKPFLPYGRQWIDESDIEAVAEALRSDFITTGAKVEEFEDKVATYCGAKYAVAVSSGTAALHCACHAAGISEGDTVITTPITFFATIASIMFCGGIPILADVDEKTMNIDPAEIRKGIPENAKAIIPVDFAGHPAALVEINWIAKRNGLVVIEDACHALGAEYGAEYNERKVGSISDMTVFSFHPVKAISTGEGGMILTNNPAYNDRLRLFRNHNLQKGWIQEPGYNYRLTDFQCALGISQLRKLDSFIARRREIARRYNEAFGSLEEITIPVELAWSKSAYHLYVIQLDTIDRDSFRHSLAREGIGSQVHYIPAHLQPTMRQYDYMIGDFPKAEAYYLRALSLPIFPKMADDDVQRVINAVTKVVQNAGR